MAKLYLIAQAAVAIALLSCAPAVAKSLTMAPAGEIAESPAAQFGRSAAGDLPATETGFKQPSSEVVTETAAPDLEPFASSFVADTASTSHCDGECFNQPCRPRWYFQADALLLWRDKATKTDQLWFTSALSSKIPTLAMGSGPQFTLGFNVNQNHGWEGRYFSIQGMNGTTREKYRYSVGPSPSDVEGFDDNFNEVIATGTTRTNYQSDVRDAEVNYLYTWNAFSLLAGFRFVQWNEVYDFDSWYGLNTGNNLYGGQLGSRWKTSFQTVNWEITGPCKKSCVT